MAGALALQEYLAGCGDRAHARGRQRARGAGRRPGATRADVTRVARAAARDPCPGRRARGGGRRRARSWGTRSSFARARCCADGVLRRRGRDRRVGTHRRGASGRLPARAAVRSGTVSTGTTRIRATRRADESAYAAVVRLARDAERQRALFVRTADCYAVFFLPLTAAVAGIAWRPRATPSAPSPCSSSRRRARSSSQPRFALLSGVSGAGADRGWS